jgi:hypothetical protein
VGSRRKHLTAVLPRVGSRAEFKLITESKVSPTADKDTEVAVASLFPKFGEQRGELCIIANFLAFKSSRAEAEQALRRLHDDRPGSPNFEMFCEATTVDAQYCRLEEVDPKDHRYCADSSFLGNDADIVSILESVFTSLPTPETNTLYLAMNPVSRGPQYRNNANDRGMALSMQTDHFFAAYAVWDEEGDDERCTAWVRDAFKELEGHEDGSYTGDADFQVRKAKFWADENASRLMEIRRKWDPEGKICGYLDEGDKNGTSGLPTKFR